MRADSGVVPVPAMAWWVAMSVRSWPFWAQVGVRADLRDVMRGVEKVRREEEGGVEARGGAAEKERGGGGGGGGGGWCSSSFLSS